MMDYEKIVAKAAREMKPSGIRKFFDIAQTLEGVISLGVGEPDFQTPWKIRQAAIMTLEKGKTTYTSNRGLQDLCKEISVYLEETVRTSYDPNSEIIVTVGGSEGIDASIRAMVEPGDEVLIVEPSFVCYAPLVSLSGGIPVTIEAKAENGFKVTAEEVKEKITDKTKMLILPYPNNPTGAVMRKDDLEKIAEVIRKTNIVIVSDEIYSELTYGEKHYSIVQCEGMKERTILINGFSKGFAMTGWRLGFLAGPKEGHGSGNGFVANGFNKLGLDCIMPDGAFYVFPSIKSTGLSSKDFCEKLVYSQKVAVVPGDAFGACGEGYIRVSYAYSLNHLKEALYRIEKFLEELKNSSH